jgi:serine/threonine-protein kinase
VVRFRACERWPDPDVGYLYIVMDFVPGLTLDKWAWRFNPTARVGLHTFLKIARAMREVHRNQVLHRDLKESNILIRDGDGEPVIIDFGFGAMKGAPSETRPGRIPPGTPEYRSPQMIKFLRGEVEENTYVYTLADELWAMGVMLYWLLTDELPFGDRTEAGLNGRIVGSAPGAPHVVNPRVPEAASRLCMRMLEKEPGARLKDDDELCAALEAVLAEAEGEASWDVPLVEPASSKEAEGELDEGGEAEEEPGEEQQGMAHKPGRGGWPQEEPAARPPEQLPRPENHLAAPAKAPVVAAEAKALQEPEAVAQRLEAPAAGVGAEESGPGKMLVDKLERHSLALVAGLAVLALVMSSVGLLREHAHAPEAASASVDARAMPPPEASARSGVTPQAVSGREVAQPGKPAEAEPVAAPGRAQPPASPPTAMVHKKESRLKSEGKPTPQPRNKAQRCVPIAEWVCTAAGVCSLVLTGCSGAQVRPSPVPEPIECPAGWQEVHDRFELGRRRIGIELQGYKGENTERAPVREGPITAVVNYDRELPDGSLLFGTLRFGENRFYVTFTQAQTPDGGTHPVCLVIGHDVPARMPDSSRCSAGVGSCPAPESRPGHVKILTRHDVYEKGRL